MFQLAKGQIYEYITFVTEGVFGGESYNYSKTEYLKVIGVSATEVYYKFGDSLREMKTLDHQSIENFNTYYTEDKLKLLNGIQETLNYISISRSRLLDVE